MVVLPAASRPTCGVGAKGNTGEVGWDGAGAHASSSAVSAAAPSRPHARTIRMRISFLPKRPEKSLPKAEPMVGDVPVPGRRGKKGVETSGTARRRAG